MDQRKIETVIDDARSAGRDTLLEHEGFELLAAMGIGTPEFIFIRDAGALSEADLTALPGDRVVVKVVSPDIQHKSDAGGIAFVAKGLQQVGRAVGRMAKAFSSEDVRGYLVAQHIDYDARLGGELLFAIRWTDDFGPVVVFGAGGIYTEFLADHLGSDVAIASAARVDRSGAETILRDHPIVRLVAGQMRGQPARVALGQLIDMFLKFAELARETMPGEIEELEVNPFVISGGRLVPLDILVRCGSRGAKREEEPLPRPVGKIRQLLRPRSMAFVGVSERMNPGRVSLVNTLRAGFDRERICIVKAGAPSIEGCACYPGLDALPDAVDHLVLAVSASQIPDVLASVVDKQLAESVLLIPGGLEEKEGSKKIVAEIMSIVQRSRESEWGGPVLVGANSMGIRSQPGHYDTTFLPDYKLPMSGAPAAPIAFISQSGAFYAAKGGKLALAPRYAISVGNQTDLTIGDYLMYLKDDSEVEIFAVYAEGFAAWDGGRFLDAAREITARGKTVLLYRAGRTAAGARASASHTASLAGDYTVARQLAEQAGVVVCETTADFEGLLKLFALLNSYEVRGLRLGAISNAGFECVSIADHLADLRLAELTEHTLAGLRALLAECRLDEVVDVRNPVDLTPLMPDAPFAAATRLLIADPNVDVAIVGCVPLSPALQTLAAGSGHVEDIHRPESVAMRLVELRNQTKKAWIVAVDGGSLYDPMARLLEENGIPTFRTADRALCLFSRYCCARLRRPN
jgi:acyl-CoA synthetase (NDP forming)